MVREHITRDDKWWEIVYGYGRIQQVRAVYAKHLPESMRRLQATDADDLLSRVSPDEIADYNAKVGREVIGLVLSGSSEWDGGPSTKGDYIDNDLPEDVGNEILERIRAVISDTVIPPESKKNSPLTPSDTPGECQCQTPTSNSTTSVRPSTAYQVTSMTKTPD